MNGNPKNSILMSGNIRQKRLVILEYFDAYICHHYQLSNILNTKSQICFKNFQFFSDFLGNLYIADTSE